MFRYEYPLFEKKKVLRIEMLEQLRDYPKNYLTLFYSGYGEGILCGCEITWEKEKLTIHPGIINHGGNLYFMEDIYTVDCPANGKVRYVKVKFLKEIIESGKIIGNAEIIFDEIIPDSSSEMELCRFRLQDGSRLRYRQENFHDHSTEYDTVNLLYTPYASRGKSTLHPAVLMAYAKETIGSGAVNVYDVSFAMKVLANDGIVSANCIREYIDARLEGIKPYYGEKQTASGIPLFDGYEMYQGLLKVLEKQERQNREITAVTTERKGVMLM